MSSKWEEWKKNLGETRPWDVLNSENHIDQKTTDQRMDICKTCPELIQLTKQCKKCGCFMELKTKLEYAKCPIGKW
jgi:hypothetical protein